MGCTCVKGGLRLRILSRSRRSSTRLLTTLALATSRTRMEPCSVWARHSSSQTQRIIRSLPKTLRRQRGVVPTRMVLAPRTKKAATAQRAMWHRCADSLVVCAILTGPLVVQRQHQRQDHPAEARLEVARTTTRIVAFTPILVTARRRTSRTSAGRVAVFALAVAAVARVAGTTTAIATSTRDQVIARAAPT